MCVTSVMCVTRTCVPHLQTSPYEVLPCSVTILGMNATGHIQLVEHQLQQLGKGLAMATALGRKLILPSLVCGYDKAW